jgi:hypothetical protein
VNECVQAIRRISDRRRDKHIAISLNRTIIMTMADSDKIIVLVCPECKKTEQTILDADDPPQTALVELPCPECLETNNDLSGEHIFKDAAGVWLLP